MKPFLDLTEEEFKETIEAYRKKAEDTFTKLAGDPANMGIAKKLIAFDGDNRNFLKTERNDLGMHAVAYKAVFIDLTKDDID